MAQTIVDIKKEGACISFYVEGREKPYIVDLAHESITSFTGKQLIHFPTFVIEKATFEGEKALIYRAVNYGGDYAIKRLHFLEPFLSYPELYNKISLWNLPGKCPKGYINWVKERNKRIDKDTLEEFEAEQGFLLMGNETKEIYKMIISEDSPFNENDRIACLYRRATKEQIKIFNKIFKVSIKNFSWNFESNIRRFAYIYFNKRLDRYENEYCFTDEELNNVLDTNRNFKYNLKLLDIYADSQKDTKISKTLTTIKDIEKLSNDMFTIVVPNSVEDLIAEGKMQNNCVGHYYNNSILREENYIYFIRKAENPNKSYITNRYNIDYRKTIESKKVNNSSNNDKEAIELIKEIDKEIRKILKNRITNNE